MDASDKKSGQIENNVNPYSRPSELRITDIRTTVDENHGERPAPIVRIDTNQGIVGYGQARNGSTKTYILMLKNRLLGENPCDVDRLFRRIKQFGGHGRQGGGVSAIEVALMDLAGKAYGVPVYQLLGGRFRDKIRCYCDTPWVADPTLMGSRLKERMQRGFTFLKMDLGIQLLAGISDAVVAPAGSLEQKNMMQPLRFVHLTDKGVDLMCRYVEEVRSVIGYEIPLALDHFGPIALESCIRLAQALDRYSLAWLEDMIPWQYTRQYVRLAESCNTPLCTGENIYLKEGFMELFQSQAISVAHPDLLCSGGIMETKKIGDLAQEHGICMVIHHNTSPIGAMASVHCAAATENFVALEMHAVDVDYWDNMVRGVAKPIVQNGYIPVPQGPGLGIELNEEEIRRHIDPGDPGYFEATPEWDNEYVSDALDLHARHV
ncbi:MAG: mandelate racemase/muconate lactonizing enzyme family protein [Thermodesulfobacteriota bacterium]